MVSITIPVIAQFANTKDVGFIKIKPMKFILDLWIKTIFLSSLPIEMDPCERESKSLFLSCATTFYL